MADPVSKIVKPTAEFLEDIARKIPEALGTGHHTMGSAVHDAADVFEEGDKELGGDAAKDIKTAAKDADKTAAGEAGTVGGIPEGPPWPAGDDIAGSARGKGLRPVNKRHTVSGVKSGPAKAENSLILPGYEQAVKDDIAQIAAGHADWDPVTQRYTINGRSYGIEPSGTVFPGAGDGIVNLSRNEYSALKELIKAAGDPEKVPAFTRAPHFVNDPQSIAAALALFHRIFS